MKYFRNVVVCDFEYEVADGNLPAVLCMVAYVLDANLRLIDVIRLWRGEFGATPPFDIGPDTLFVAYSAWAELTCFQTLSWKFPDHVFDLHVAYLATSNILLPYDPDEKRKKDRKGLSHACRAYGLTGWEKIDKPEMAKGIGEGRWRDYGQPAVFDYCEEDVRNSAELLRRQLAGYGSRPPIDPHLIIRWSEYAAKSVSRIQARGMPIDTRLWNLVQENKYAVAAALIRRFDPSQAGENPIYNRDHEWNNQRFETWLASLPTPITWWPRLDSGALDLERDTFRLMFGAHPAIEGLCALREVLGVIVRARIPIGRDGRNRPSLFPFATATGRNAHARSLYNTHASLRSFMKFAPDKIGVYLDWRTQEIGVAASRSGDGQLREDYLSGDTYHALARMCGLTDDSDVTRWKRENKDQRQRMKQLQLGINYGMGIRSLARGLDRHPLIGSEVIIRHKHRYPRFWEWRADMVQHAMLDRVIRSEFDAWPLHLTYAPNQRTIFNFPMQSGGAEMLRRAANHLCAADLVPSMLIHDGILLEVDNEEQVGLAIEIMRKTGAQVCDGLEIGVDIDQKLTGGKRYRDKRPVALRIWGEVLNVLGEIGVLPQAAGL